jgi:thioredoxin reductase (NADPH)
MTKGGELTGVEVTQEGKAPFTISCDGLFVAIGLIPENEAYKDLADLNAWGYFDSDESCVTRTPGIFAAGDCRSKSVRQVVTACADGASAALSAIRYINALSV